jgi:SAM-dependent methyltransferase
MTATRYDGQTDWYESFASTELIANARAGAIEQLGAGRGRCLDLGCGTGLAIAALVDAGWSVVGTDLSQDQLNVARRHFGDIAELLNCDAHDLPFDDGEFDAVVSFLTHTDFDDVSTVFSQVCRVLRSGGTFVYLGVHPCFGSPFVARNDAEDVEGAVALLRPGYRMAGWQHLPPDPESTKIRARVGINHLPLAGLLNAVTDAGLTIVEVQEPGDEDPPFFLTVKATKA